MRSCCARTFHRLVVSFVLLSLLLSPLTNVAAAAPIPVQADKLSSSPGSTTVLQEEPPTSGVSQEPTGQEEPPTAGVPQEPTDSEEPAPPLDIMVTSGMMVLQTQRYLPKPEEVFTLTVDVYQDSGISVKGHLLTVQIPEGLTLLSKETAWILPALGDGELFQQKVEVQVAQGKPGDVFRVNATLSSEGFAPKTEDLLIGVGGAGDEMTVLLAPQHKLAGTDVIVTPLSDRAQDERQDAATAQAEVKPVADESSMVRTWDIVAMKADSVIHQLDEAATLLISTATLATEGVKPTELVLFTRQTEEDAWQPVPTEYRAEEQLLVARVYHFSQWGLGGSLSASGELLPSTRGFSSDAFTGYASVHYGIETPSGLGGLSPALSLSYSSGTADDLESFNGDYGYDVQADWAGLGWNLGGVSYIARDFGSGDYQLVLNGESAVIKWNGTKWVTDPQMFLKIDHYNGQRGYYRIDVDDWIITAKDGTKYYFGSYELDAAGEPIHSWTSVIFRDLYINNGWKSMRVGSKWYLRAIVDPVGNYAVYFYDVETASMGGHCLRNVWWPGSDLYYDRATYLREVQWSGNLGVGNVPVRMRVILARENRPDWQIAHWNNSCMQARYGQQRLKSLTVQAMDATTNGWHTLRTYVLGYTQSQLHSLLTSIAAYGKNGAGLLHTYTFGYTGSYNNVRLDWANNGQGGVVNYDYGLSSVTDCISCSLITWKTGAWPRRRPVSLAVYTDGNLAQVNSYYSYSGIKGQVVNNSFEYLGHEYSSNTIYTFNPSLNISRAERRTENWYYQRIGTSVDPKRGRSYKQQVRAGDTDAIMSKTQTSWQYTANAGSTWVYKANEQVDTYDTDGGDNGTARTTYYTYESSWGNITRVDEWNGASLLRYTTTAYNWNSTFMSKYIVDRPSQVRVYDAANNCASEIRTSYNDNGLVTRSERPISYCGDTNSANIVATDYTYDGVGNVVSEVAPGRTIVTSYESYFKLFPVRRYNNANGNLDERVQYYGVLGADGVANGLSTGDAKAYWGAVQQFCATDDFCTRQSYDEFGRPKRRWERLAENAGWPSDASATTAWSYVRYQTQGSTQKANVVTEWHNPRCEGNFTRTLYNGFGEVIQVHAPRQGWSSIVDGCGSSYNYGETVVHYAYDGLGRQIRVSAPVAVTFAWMHTPGWGAGSYTETTYDAIDRVRKVRQPNGSEVENTYSFGHVAPVQRDGLGTERLTNYQIYDSVGRLIGLRNYRKQGGSWAIDTQIDLAYDVNGNLTTVQRNGYPYVQTSMTYDLLGRKIAMTDADLGSWGYEYDQAGNLIRQTDARGYSTCLSYNG